MNGKLMKLPVQLTTFTFKPLVDFFVVIRYLFLQFTYNKSLNYFHSICLWLSVRNLKTSKLFNALRIKFVSSLIIIFVLTQCQSNIIYPKFKFYIMLVYINIGFPAYLKHKNQDQILLYINFVIRLQFILSRVMT